MAIARLVIVKVFSMVSSSLDKCGGGFPAPIVFMNNGLGNQDLMPVPRHIALIL
jgi:hypothetical protein